MPIAQSAVVKLWSERLIERLMQRTNMRGFVVDHTAELGGRKSMELTDLKQDIRLNTRNNNNADFGARQDTDAASVTLTADKSYDFNVGVGWLDEMETVGSLAAQTNRWGTNKIEIQIQNDILAALAAADPYSTEDIAIKTDGTAGSLLTDEGIIKAMDWILFKVAEKENLGQMSFAFLTGSKIRAAIMRFLRDKGHDYAQATLARDAFTGSEIPIVGGARVYTVTSIVPDTTAAANDVNLGYLIDPSETIHFAMQIQRTRSIPDPAGPRDLLQGLLQYGTVIPEMATGDKAETYDLLRADIT